MHAASLPGAGTELDRLVDQADFRGLRRHFPTAEQAFGYFASGRGRRYPLEGVDAPCVVCGRTADIQIVRARWQYNFPNVGYTVLAALAALTHVHMGEPRRGEFDTYHAACRGCYRRWWAWRVAGTILLVPAVLGIALGGLMAVLFSSLYVGGTFGPADRRQLPYVIAAGATAALAGGLLWRVGLLWRIPETLRGVAQHPIFIHQLRRRPLQEWLAERAQYAGGEDEGDDGEEDV